MTELVVLVDDQNKQIGVADKSTVHSRFTPLHRGFSVFLFNQNKELLVTQRAMTKKTFPGVWSNSVCGHPAPEEEVVDAAKRRLKKELNIIPSSIEFISDYRYQFTDQNGIVENEICPILVARSYAYPHPDETEIMEWKWLPWKIFLLELENYPANYSPWCREEAKLVDTYLSKK